MSFNSFSVFALGLKWLKVKDMNKKIKYTLQRGETYQAWIYTTRHKLKLIDRLYTTYPNHQSYHIALTLVFIFETPTRCTTTKVRYNTKLREQQNYSCQRCRTQLKQHRGIKLRYPK